MDRTGGTGRIDKSGNSKRTVEIRIRRAEPLSGDCTGESVYTLDYLEGMTLHNALDFIYKEIDPTIAFRPYKCNKGVCMSCLVSVNGKRQQACTTFLNPDDRVLVEPDYGRPVVRDLVTIP
jgi:succinate dehydrogenase/fumarate reductase-like Fe-S protein